MQIVTGYGEAGNALVTGGVDKVIFVGSTGVGKAVMRVGSSASPARTLLLQSTLIQDIETGELLVTLLA